MFWPIQFGDLLCHNTTLIAMAQQGFSQRPDTSSEHLVLDYSSSSVCGACDRSSLASGADVKDGDVETLSPQPMHSPTLPKYHQGAAMSSCPPAHPSSGHLWLGKCQQAACSLGHQMHFTLACQHKPARKIQSQARRVTPFLSHTHKAPNPKPAPLLGKALRSCCVLHWLKQGADSRACIRNTQGHGGLGRSCLPKMG